MELNRTEKGKGRGLAHSLDVWHRDNRKRSIGLPVRCVQSCTTCTAVADSGTGRRWRNSIPGRPARGLTYRSRSNRGDGHS